MWRIVPQPNGQYAIWSTVTDSLVRLNRTPDQLRDIWEEKYSDGTVDPADVRRDVDIEIAALQRRGGDPWHDAIETIRACHGDAYAAECDAQGRSADPDAAARYPPDPAPLSSAQLHRDLIVVFPLNERDAIARAVAKGRAQGRTPSEIEALIVSVVRRLTRQALGLES